MTTTSLLRHFWRLPLSSALILIGCASAAEPPILVSYEPMRPSSTFGDQWQAARAKQCTLPSTPAKFQFGSLRNTMPGTITLSAYLADEQGQKLGESKPMEMPESAVQPVLLNLANYCNNPLPTHLYLVSSAEPNKALKAKGYDASVEKWEGLIGGRSVGSAALSWSAYVGNTSVSPAWLPPNSQWPKRAAITPDHSMNVWACLGALNDCLGQLLGWNSMPQPQPQTGSPTFNRVWSSDLVNLSRADDSTSISLNVQSMNGGWTHLQLGSASLAPGKYEGLSPFVGADNKLLPVTLNVRQGPWTALLFLGVAALFGWLLNWIRTRVLPGLELVASLRAYRDDLRKRYKPGAAVPGKTVGYIFLTPTLTELDELLEQAARLTSPLNTDLLTLAELQAALALLKQRELDWQAAYQLLNRLNRTIPPAQKTLHTGTNHLVSPTHLLDTLQSIVSGAFNSFGAALPRTFDAALWLQLKPTLETALELTRLMLVYPFNPPTKANAALWTVLAQSPGDPIALEAAKSDYSLAGAALAAAPPSLTSPAPLMPTPPRRGRRRGSGPPLFYPERWPLKRLVAVRMFLGFLVALVIIVFTVLSGFQTLYIPNAIWGASPFDYFTALSWGLGLSGGLSLFVSVIENLRFTGKSAA